MSSPLSNRGFLRFTLGLTRDRVYLCVAAVGLGLLLAGCSRSPTTSVSATTSSTSTDTSDELLLEAFDVIEDADRAASRVGGIPQELLSSEGRNAYAQLYEYSQASRLHPSDYGVVGRLIASLRTELADGIEPTAQVLVDGSARERVWKTLDPSMKLKVASLYLRQAEAERFRSSATPKALVRETNFWVGLSGQKTLRGLLRYSARSLAEMAASDQRSDLLDGDDLVGKSGDQVRTLLGAPDHVQEIGGQDYWYYNDGSNMYQLIFSGSSVAQVNKY